MSISQIHLVQSIMWVTYDELQNPTSRLVGKEIRIAGEGTIGNRAVVTIVACLPAGARGNNSPEFIIQSKRGRKQMTLVYFPEHAVGIDGATGVRALKGEHIGRLDPL